MAKRRTKFEIMTEILRIAREEHYDRFVHFLNTVDHKSSGNCLRFTHRYWW